MCRNKLLKDIFWFIFFLWTLSFKQCEIPSRDFVHGKEEGVKESYFTVVTYHLNFLQISYFLKKRKMVCNQLPVCPSLKCSTNLPGHGLQVKIHFCAFYQSVNSHWLHTMLEYHYILHYISESFLYSITYAWVIARFFCLIACLVGWFICCCFFNSSQPKWISRNGKHICAKMDCFPGKISQQEAKNKLITFVLRFFILIGTPVRDEFSVNLTTQRRYDIPRSSKTLMGLNII